MRSINLKTCGVGRYDDVSPFIITDNKLELKIKLPNVNGEFYFVGDNNGNKFKRCIPLDGVVMLNGLTAGELKAEVKHYIKGGIIKEYKIEPLIIKEIDSSLSAEPEIAVIRREMEELKKTFAKEQEKNVECRRRLDARISECERHIQYLQMNMAGLLRFACTDYKNNVYLGGESVDGFINEFGFKLTDEDKEKLKGENRNAD